MWIKSLYDDTWVNMKHITHFSIKMDSEPFRRGNNLLYAYLDTTDVSWNRNSSKDEQDQARILVCQGSVEKCQQFIVEQQLLESTFQWLGYLVAGGIGAVLTLIFQNFQSGGP